MKRKSLLFRIIMILALVSALSVGESAAQRGRPQGPPRQHRPHHPQQHPHRHRPSQPHRPGMAAEYHTLIVAGNIEVVITPNVRQAIVEGDDRRGNSVRIEDNHRGTLTVRRVSGNNRRMRVLVPASRLNHINVTDGAILRWEGYIDTDKCTIDCHGNSEIRGGINAHELGMNVARHSKANLHGRVGNLHFAASGKSEVDCFKLYASTVRGLAASKSTVGVYAEDAVFIDAETGARVRFAGRPATVNKEERSGGKVRRK